MFSSKQKDGGAGPTLRLNFTKHELIKQEVIKEFRIENFEIASLRSQ
jgi:hypothetical protein